MKTYKIESMKIQGKTKKEAVEKYISQHFETFMCKCEKSLNTLYKSAIQI